MNSIFYNRCYKIIGTEISTQKFEPRCYALAVHSSMPKNPQAIIHAYTEIRMQHMLQNWLLRKETLKTNLITHSMSQPAKLNRQQFSFILFLKIFILIGLVGGFLDHLLKSGNCNITWHTVGALTLVMCCAVMMPDMIYQLTSKKLGLKFFRWNWYAALLASAFSFANAVQYLKYAYYHG